MKITYTNGILSKLTDDYYTLTLFNNGKQVYKADIPTNEALLIKSSKIVNE